MSAPTPYYADDAVTMYLGDFREVLPALDALAVDAVVTDPPYGETCLEWDTWPVGWPAVVAEYSRSMWCFGSFRMFLDRAQDFDAWKLSQDVVWEKHNGSSNKNDRFRRVHEHAVHWYQGDWASIHHVTPTTQDATARAMRRSGKPAHWQGEYGPSHYRSEEGGSRLMRSVIFARSMHGNAINETEKPLGVVLPLVEYSTPRGGSCSMCLQARDPRGWPRSSPVVAQCSSRSARHSARPQRVGCHRGCSTWVR